MPVCAICMHFALPPQVATGTVGLLTGSPRIVAAAVDRLGGTGEDQHIVVNACPEHVVDVYRGRVLGVRMAWKATTEPFPLDRQNPAATFASRA